ncbi:MAG: hypothetical protein GAK45_00777 [Pseudomonas citronellolis]|nr:MAG: hypothetical protein GAK45_00777 [Pseudomonas citronellolis]
MSSNTLFASSSRALPRALRLGLLLAGSLSLGNAWAEPYLWLGGDAGGVQAQTGELLHEGPAEASPALQKARAFLADGKDLPLQPATAGYRLAKPSAAGDLRFTAQAVASDGSLRLYEARYGRSETKAINDLELVPTEPNGTRFRLFWKGNPVPASEVTVETSAGWQQTLHGEVDGSIALTTPQYPTLFKSRYVLQVTAKVNGKVTVDGKTYEDVRHVATLSFDVQ